MASEIVPSPNLQKGEKTMPNNAQPKTCWWCEREIKPKETAPVSWSFRCEECGMALDEDEVFALIETIKNRERKQRNITNVCSWCGGDATVFGDELSYREHAISGLCETCLSDLKPRGEE